MRLRNKPWANDYFLREKDYTVHNPAKYRGKWAKKIFKNNHPLNIEIGCGKGGFILTLAKNNPDQNYIAIEKFPSVAVNALKKLVNEKLSNLKIITDDAQTLTEIFAPEEISKIYLNFSDPWPKKRHAKRRLTSKKFLPLYDEILKNNGRIYFKTDNDDLFTFSITEFGDNNWTIVKQTTDLYANPMLLKNNIATEYEQRFVEMGKNINYAEIKK
ncbi:tRNA (guanosine(46)-N7)-methyltransferase TrmB [Spiroplasma chrysopicola]|uniref:tRNA (guanine-N(7)-)-methyltransferase n=1 Tax=Spiroplasma chrysopicola DF-1 TaxID=1276227 RepID=R4UJR6_9MOLU|nr:tRNA (guanosine(46)-N7)-methyltransferase TrmB [Spiroplasma chrysopicola]AGM25551.1 tRNA (guanine-N(7)-)-methyltransferase [Spiroplasma chrysopicola DF-1]